MIFKQKIALIVVGAAFSFAALVLCVKYLVQGQNDDMLEEIIVISPMTSPFYSGLTMEPGFCYELLTLFADSNDLKLHHITEENLQKATSQIKNSSADLLLYPLPTTLEMKKRLEFTAPIYFSRLVLVQNAPRKRDKESKLVEDVYEMEDICVNIEAYSPYAMQLEFIREETGVWFEIHESEELSNQELAKLLIQGKIDYFACDEHTARYLKKRNPKLDIEMVLGFNQPMALGINSNNKQLLQLFNDWLAVFVTTNTYRQLFTTYF